MRIRDTKTRRKRYFSMRYIYSSWNQDEFLTRYFWNGYTINPTLFDAATQIFEEHDARAPLSKVSKI